MVLLAYTLASLFDFLNEFEFMLILYVAQLKLTVHLSNKGHTSCEALLTFNRRLLITWIYFITFEHWGSMQVI